GGTGSCPTSTSRARSCRPAARRRRATRTGSWSGSDDPGQRPGTGRRTPAGEGARGDGGARTGVPSRPAGAPLRPPRRPHGPPAANVPRMTTAAHDPAPDGSAAHPRFAQALRDLGLAHLIAEVRRFPDATRTAAEAAAAVGCELSQICKSLIFAADGVPVLV